MIDINQLKEHFGIPGVLDFHATASGLAYASVTTPHATATVYIQGAHLTAWQPMGQQPAIFVSRKSDFAPGKAIRGGVPIAFPWFATRHDGKPGPSHGFARIQDWTLAFAAMAGEELHLTFTLGPTEISRNLGYDNFRLAYQLIIGRTLTMQLTVANDAAAPLVFEEALHTYYTVADIHETTVDGLDGVTYVDKTDKFQLKVQHGAVIITETSDRVYLNTESTCVLHDTGGKRRVTIAKTGSNTTVIWNPWESGAAKLPDLDPTEWHEYIAVETSNAAVNAITLAQGATHVMQAHVTVEDVKA
jgi:glucose-6-phosphate 1-epimerase